MTDLTTTNPPPNPRASAIPSETNGEVTPRLKATIKHIAQFADLEPDWDSYGGDPPSPVARAEAGRWVEIVAELFEARVGNTAVPYSVTLLANGGVQVEWRGRGGIVELEIGPE